MVLDYYNLKEQPFGVTPDARFLFLSDTHREALASLLYGIEAGRGFIALIAPPGLGKTTLLVHALNQLQSTAKTVFLFQTITTPADLLRAILTDLGVPETRGSLIEMQAQLNEILVQQARAGKRLVVMIDEAQHLDNSVLEFVRMLSNFETSREKLLQIVLSGQPGLAEKMGSPDMVQLRQRVSMFSRLKPFSAEETTQYIDHRLRAAGYTFESPLFTAGALAAIAQHSQGIPRNINNYCFNAMALGCASGRKTIDGEIVREIAEDLALGGFRKNNEPAAPVVITPREAQVPAGWLSKLAIAIALLIVFGGTIFASYRWPAAKAAVHADPAALRPGTPDVGLNRYQPGAPPVSTPLQQQSVATPVPAPTAKLNSGSVGTNSPPAAVAGVQVTPGQTLFGICSAALGGCDAETLQEVVRLNPDLSNPDHIEPGQNIRVPVTRQRLTVVQNSPARTINTSVAEKAGNE